MRLLYVKYEYFKKHSDSLASQCEDAEEKCKAETEMKRHFLNKVRELEGMYMSSSAEVVQHKKEAVVTECATVELKEAGARDGGFEGEGGEGEPDVEEGGGEEGEVDGEEAGQSEDKG